MKTKDFILQELKRKGQIKTADIVQAIGISRQTVAQHFRELIAEKKITKIGSTRNSNYIPYSPRKVKRKYLPVNFKKEYLLKKLDEDIVFEELKNTMALRRSVSEKGVKILNYAFTEMLNNAIDHSKSEKGEVRAECSETQFIFEVRDFGVGIFENIRKKFKLKNYYEAIELLLKGKQTTNPKHHSGQGIFFTSKISDSFSLESGSFLLQISNGKKEKETYLTERKRVLKGTKVTFQIRNSTRKELRKLFDEYSNSDYEFDKSKVFVRLSKQNTEFLSRSEAKRMLFGLDRFKRIVLDFSKIKGIGQSFADEVFRVFNNRYPDINIKVLNANEAVCFMIKRANKNITIKN